MARSEALKKAQERYLKQNVTRVTVSFSPVDKDILAYLDTKPSRSGYLKELLREAYEREALGQARKEGIQ